MKKSIFNAIGLLVLSFVFTISVSTLGIAESKAKGVQKKQVSTAKVTLKKTSKKTTKVHKIKPSPLVKKVQIALNKLGGKLKVDGVAGVNTTGALRTFQKKNKLKETGRADKATLTKLRVK
jgi:peptidoglycan hydrolase-like protein with peptidoglycan-binding domain